MPLQLILGLLLTGLLPGLGRKLLGSAASRAAGSVGGALASGRTGQILKRGVAGLQGAKGLPLVGRRLPTDVASLGRSVQSGLGAAATGALGIAGFVLPEVLLGEDGESFDDAAGSGAPASFPTGGPFPENRQAVDRAEGDAELRDALQALLGDDQLRELLESLGQSPATLAPEGRIF